MNTYFKNISISIAFILIGSPYAKAEYDPNLKSIDTPPAISQQMFNKVKSNGLGQYSYAKGLSSKFIESEGVKLHYVEGGSKGT
ncbi:alpha/beta hydrolase, partial [Acinetobacter lactucae]|nr:alpha/beta hydrolase [Acinetobacter lactucae]